MSGWNGMEALMRDMPVEDLIRKLCVYATLSRWVDQDPGCLEVMNHRAAWISWLACAVWLLDRGRYPEDRLADTPTLGKRPFRCERCPEVLQHPLQEIPLCCSCQITEIKEMRMFTTQL